MPATSAAQKRLMDAAAHSPAFAKKVGVPSKVAKEFSTASKGQKFERGGVMAKGKFPFEKSGKDVEMKGKGKEGSKKEKAFDRMQAKGYAKGGGIESKGKTKGRFI